MLFFWITIGLVGAWFLWFSQRYAWWARRVDWSHPRILMYHMIGHSQPGSRYRGMRVATRNFEKQLAWLSKQGFHFSTMTEVVKASVPSRTVVITFDDGYEDNYTEAYPLLRKYGARATLYLVADREDGSDWSAKKKSHHNSGELTREPKLSHDQVREMIESGTIELGAHTLTHANLAALDAAGKQHEITSSKLRLEEEFNTPVNSFAYPFGIWNEDDKSVVAEAGFTSAVTTDQGIDPSPYPDPLAIRRIKVSGKEGMLAFKLRVRCGRRGLFK